MNLSQLRFAQAVAVTGSFTAAAGRCFVTQPTLSNGIAQLEAEIGGRLFERTTRKVGLTEFGRHVLPYIDDLLAAQAGLLLQARAFLRPEKRLIRIGASPMMNPRLLKLMVEPYKLHNADVDIVLREMNMIDLFRMLGSGQLDFVLSIAKGQKGPWTTTLLYEEPLLFIPRGLAWPRRNAVSVTLNEIADETFVMPPDACGLANATRALFRRHRRTLREYSGEAMSYHALQQWAELGIGAAILPSSKVSVPHPSRLTITDKSGTEVRVSYQAAWPTAVSPAPHVQAFARHLRHVVPQLMRGLDSDRMVTA